MPKVGKGKEAAEFPYTKEGVEAAEDFAQKTNQEINYPTNDARGMRETYQLGGIVGQNAFPGDPLFGQRPTLPGTAATMGMYEEGGPVEKYYEKGGKTTESPGNIWEQNQAKRKRIAEANKKAASDAKARRAARSIKRESIGKARKDARAKKKLLLKNLKASKKAPKSTKEKFYSSSGQRATQGFPSAKMAKRTMKRAIKISKKEKIKLAKNLYNLKYKKGGKVKKVDVGDIVKAVGKGKRFKADRMKKEVLKKPTKVIPKEKPWKKIAKGVASSLFPGVSKGVQVIKKHPKKAKKIAKAVLTAAFPTTAVVTKVAKKVAKKVVKKVVKKKKSGMNQAVGPVKTSR